MQGIQIVADPAYYGLRELVDSKSGFLNWMARLRVQGGYPRSHYYAARSCNADVLQGDMQRWPFHTSKPSPAAGTTDRQSAGMHVDAKSAFIACICEQIERYCCGFTNDLLLLWGTEGDLRSEGVNCMSQRSFEYLREEDYGGQNLLHPWTPRSRFRWAKCVNMSTGQDIYVPAQLLYMPYNTVRNEPLLVEQSTSGLACHRTAERAFYSATCEVVERDSFFIYWYSMYAAPTLAINSLSGYDWRLDLLLERIGAIPGLQLICKDITSDNGIPCFLSIFRHPEGRRLSGLPAMAFAAAASLDPVDALTKAINELLGTYALAGVLARENAVGKQRTLGPAMWNTVRTLSDHVAVFARPEVLDYVRWIDDGPVVDFASIVSGHSRDFASASAWMLVRECVRRLQQSKLEAYYCDMTTPDVASCGFSVARSYVPGAVPITAMHILRAIGPRRIREVPARLGYVSPSRLNIVPHPYP